MANIFPGCSHNCGRQLSYAARSRTEICASQVDEPPCSCACVFVCVHDSDCLLDVAAMLGRRMHWLLKVALFWQDV